MQDMTPERTQAIDDYKKIDSGFTDYTHFEGEKTERQAQKEAFLSGVDYNPGYNYKKLDNLRYDDKLQAKKTAIYESILELDCAKKEDGANALELELYADFYELRLKKIMLVEAARDLNQAYSSSEWETSKNAFLLLNEETYGEFDVPKYRSMITTEYDNVCSFNSTSERSNSIKNELINYLADIKSNDEREKPLMNDEGLNRLHDVVVDRYSNILSVIPNTDDSVYYNAEQCAEIINNTLEVAGLADLGWAAEINSTKTSPVTNEAKSRIYLPSNTKRNANELRRLVLHEQEVHARRSQNGRESGLRPLKNGTADYADAEEGLGVILECAVAGNWDNASFNRARDRYITAGLAFGFDGQLPRNARQTHDILWRILAVRNSNNGDISDNDVEKAKNDAYTHVENAFRGTAFWMSGVIYSKLKVYYEGLEKNAQFLTDNIYDINGALNKAMIGKYNHTDKSESEIVYKILGTK